MPQRGLALTLAAALLAMPMADAANGPDLRPFTATYHVDYGRMSVGHSRLTLTRAAMPGHWLLEFRSKASGLARLMVGGELHQSSSLVIDGAGVRPLTYRFDDGTKRTAKDIALDFDWSAGRVTGTAEGKPVTAETSAGLQDALSQHLLLMTELAAGRTPQHLAMIEKRDVKHYEYRFLRNERLKTPYGELDAVVYRSERVGGTRYTLQWFAPSLRWLCVRSEQHRDGKRLFTLQLQSYAAL
jgi:Protein of unknown function (DUF3108)